MATNQLPVGNVFSWWNAIWDKLDNSSKFADLLPECFRYVVKSLFFMTFSFHVT